MEEKYHQSKLDDIFAVPENLNRNHNLFNLKMQREEFEAV